jgi:endonuclease/exonuclease/phosphatase family metal-dependent hydrolase
VDVTNANSGDSLDVGDRRVHLERLGDCDATLRADCVAPQAANEGVTKKGMIRMLLPQRGNKNMKFKVEVTHPKQRQQRWRGASLDVGDRLVDLERFGDRDATLGAEIVVLQAAKRGGNKTGVIGMLLPLRGNKNTKGW